MKLIKKFWAPIFIVCFLLLGYIIGQVRKNIRADQKLETEISEVNEAVSDSSADNSLSIDGTNSYDSVDANEWSSYNITFENSNKTTDTPWGYTAGIVEVDDIGKCAFLTPNTSFTLSDLDANSKISLQAKLHPWIAEQSDGAGVIVWIMDENGDIINVDKIDINNGDSWVNIQYSIGEYENASQIKFLCNNGKNDDDVCDWVIFRLETTILSSFGNDDYIRSATYYGNV